MSNLELYNMDCMDLMGKYPDKYFDLAIVDPPYGINIANRGKVGDGCLAEASKFTPKNWDKFPPNINYFIELKRVSKNQIIWGANHFIQNIKNVNSSCWIVWDKNNGNTNFADCELAYTSFKKAVRKFTYTWHGMLQGNMKKKETRIHMTQKPVALYSWILNNYAKKGDKILDTHLGSGSIAIACHDNNFDLVGSEIDKEYYDNMMERVHEHKKQLKLF